MIGLRRTASMASMLAIQASCQAAKFQKCHVLQIVVKRGDIGRTPDIASQICDSPNSCAAHNSWADGCKSHRHRLLHAIHAIAQIHSVFARTFHVKQRRAPNPA
jgi:hypothetical protein